MSNVGAIVRARTPREIFDSALEARDQLFIGRGGRVPMDMEWLLERLVRPIYSVEPDVREDSDPALSGAYALFDVNQRTILLRESVMRKASQIEDPEAIFTIAHEIGHVCLHGNPQHFRSELPRHLPAKLCDAEWQADRFAMEFLADREAVAKWSDDAGSAARYFRTPERQMQIYLQQLRSEGVIGMRTSPPTPWEKAIQADFDF